MQNQPSITSFREKKKHLIYYILFYCLISSLGFIPAYALLYSWAVSSYSYTLREHPFLITISSFTLSGIISSQYVNKWFYTRYTFRLRDLFKPAQLFQGYAFIWITIAALSSLAYIVFQPRDYLRLYLFPAVATCIVSIVGASQWVKKLVEPDPYTKTAFERIENKKQWYHSTSSFLFVGGTFIAFVCVSHFFFLEKNFLVSVLIPALFTCAISLIGLPYVRKTKNHQLKAKTVDYSNTPYKEMRHGFNHDSVMPTGDGRPLTTETMHGKAAWMTDVDKNIYTAKDKNNKPSYEGLWLGGGFFHHKEGNLVSVAPPGTGKGAALIIPNLLWKRNYNHSFVVFDPKGTNACTTARFREAQGHKVIIIDPLGLQKLNNARHGIAPSCFNPLDHIQDDLFNGSAQIANLLLPDDPGAKDKYWNLDARNLIQVIILHIMTSAAYANRRTLITVQKTIMTAEFDKLFNEMAHNYAMNNLIADTAMGFLGMLKQANGMFPSVRGVAGASLQWLSNPSLYAVMQKSDFSPTDLANGGMTLYICQPITNKEGFATFSRLVVGFCLRANATPSNKPKAWVYYLLDEFPTMGVFPEVIEGLAFAREYRMRLWIFAQSLSQLDTTYNTSTRQEITGNATVMQAFNVTDPVTQEYFSKRIGNQTVKFYKQSQSTNSTRSATASHGGGSSNESMGLGTSSSEEYKSKPLISPDEMEQEPHIVTLTKEGPMRLVKWQYWQEAYVDLADYYRDIFQDGRADPNPNIAGIHASNNSNNNDAGWQENRNKKDDFKRDVDKKYNGSGKSFKRSG